MEIKKFPVSLCVPRGWDLAYGKGYATPENPSAVAFFFGMGQHPSLVVPECLQRINRRDRSGQGTKESSALERTIKGTAEAVPFLTSFSVTPCLRGDLSAGVGEALPTLLIPGPGQRHLPRTALRRARNRQRPGPYACHRRREGYVDGAVGPSLKAGRTAVGLREVARGRDGAKPQRRRSRIADRHRFSRARRAHFLCSERKFGWRHTDQGTIQQHGC
jgi:hypothetical protein